MEVIASDCGAGPGCAEHSTGLAAMDRASAMLARMIAQRHRQGREYARMLTYVMRRQVRAHRHCNRFKSARCAQIFRIGPLPVAISTCTRLTSDGVPGEDKEGRKAGNQEDLHGRVVTANRFLLSCLPAFLN